MADPHWVCQVCHEPITRNNGAVTIFNTNEEEGSVGSYPQIPSVRGKYEGERPDYAISVAEYAKNMSHDEENIGFKAHHYKCDPYPDSQNYEIDIKRAETLEDWCGWVIHLTDKAWMGELDRDRFLRFWWDHKKARYPDP